MKEKKPWLAVIEVDGMNRDKDYIYILREFQSDIALCRGSLNTVFTVADVRYPHHIRRQHPRKSRCWLILEERK